MLSALAKLVFAACVVRTLAFVAIRIPKKPAKADRKAPHKNEMAITGLNEQTHSDRLLDAKRILELANKAYFLYVRQNPAEQANSRSKSLYWSSATAAE